MEDFDVDVYEVSKSVVGVLFDAFLYNDGRISSSQSALLPAVLEEKVGSHHINLNSYFRNTIMITMSCMVKRVKTY